MSSETHSTDDSNELPSGDDDSDELPSWEELTRARRRLLRIIGSFRGLSTFERPNLRDDVERSDVDDVEAIIDDKARVLKTLNQCDLPNKLVKEDGYLEKVRQGGGNPIIIDYEYDEERDTHQNTVYSNTGQLTTMAFDVLDRENKPSGELDDVDIQDSNKVVATVNGIIGRQVLGIRAESNQYRLTDEAVPILEQNVEAFNEVSTDQLPPQDD